MGKKHFSGVGLFWLLVLVVFIFYIELTSSGDDSFAAFLQALLIICAVPMIFIYLVSSTVGTTTKKKKIDTYKQPRYTVIVNYFLLALLVIPILLVIYLSYSES